MEQKILSLKDDKIISEAELIEYPEELRGGRNLIKNSYVISQHYNAVDVRITAQNYEGYQRIKRIPQDGTTFGNTVISNYTIVFVNTVIGQTYTQSVAVNPDADITIALWYGTPTFCPSGVWTRLSYTFVATSTSRRMSGLLGGTFSPEFTPWIGVREWKLEKGNKATPYTPAPEDLNLSYPDFITEFKPSISDRYILTEELIEGQPTSFSNNILINEFIEQ